MRNQFPALEAHRRAYGEDNDCTVKAWAVATGIPYSKAHYDLRKVGRRPGRGVNFYSVMGQLGRMRGKRFTDVTAEWKRKGAKTMLSAERLLPKQRGIFLIFVRGHVACYRAGQLHDWAQGRRHRITRIYRVNNA